MEKDEEAARLAQLELQKARAAEENSAAEAHVAGEGDEGEGKTEPQPNLTRLRQPVKSDKGAPSRAMRIRSKDFAKRWTTRKRAEG